MGNVCKRRGKKFHDIGGRTSAEAEGVRSPRVADLSTVGSENFTGNLSSSYLYTHLLTRLIAYITAAFCLAIVATQRTDVRVRRVARFHDRYGHGEPVRRRSERPSAARLLSGTHESGDEQEEKNIGERIFTGVFPTATIMIIVRLKTYNVIIIL